MNIRELRRKKGLTQGELAKALQVTTATVSGWENGKWKPSAPQLKAIADYFGEPVTEHTQGRSIPVLGVIPAGIPLEAITDIVGYEDIPADMQGEYFGLKVHGNSMQPKYLDGDTIIVRAQPTFDNGQDCIVQVNGFDATLKSVYARDGYYDLVPYNDQYDIMQFDQVRILGVVVELRRRF